jgi:hypothetical protein
LQVQFVKANHNLIGLSRNWAAKQIGFKDNEFEEFVPTRKLITKLTFLVNRVAGIEKRRNWIIAEDRFELIGSQRLFGVIAFDQNLGGFFAQQVAQETPGVAAGCSGAFAKETDCLLRHGKSSLTQKEKCGANRRSAPHQSRNLISGLALGTTYDN